MIQYSIVIDLLHILDCSGLLCLCKKNQSLQYVLVLQFKSLICVFFARTCTYIQLLKNKFGTYLMWKTIMPLLIIIILRCREAEKVVVKR